MLARFFDFNAGILAMCAILGVTLGPPWYAVACTLGCLGMLKAGSYEREAKRREVSDE